MRCNRNKLSDILGRDVKTIDRMVAQGMPYVSRPGRGSATGWVFDTGQVLRWLTGADKSDPIAEAKVRKLKAVAEIKWMELGQKLGFLVPIHDVTRHVEAGDRIVKSRLNDLPGRLAQL